MQSIPSPGGYHLKFVMGTNRKPPVKKEEKRCDEPLAINGSFAFAIKTVMDHADKKVKATQPPSAKEEDTKKE